MFRPEPTRWPAATEKGAFVLQYPLGSPVSIARRNCELFGKPVRGRIESNDLVDFQHKCDTIRGSSGSPIIDQFGKVIGLHHKGFGPGDVERRNRAVAGPKIVESLATPIRMEMGLN